MEQFHVELGHAGIFRTFVQDLDIDEDALEQMRSLIEGKNFAALGDFLAPYAGQPGYQAVERLAYLFGGCEVLDEAEALLGRKDTALEYLRKLYEILVAAGYGQYIRFDLGMVHQIDYYTGVIFRGYVEGAGDAVLSGGRYDNLCQAFGRSAQAIGFAVDVDVVAGCIQPAELPRVNTVIHYQSTMLAKALQIINALPQGSCELSPCFKLESTMNLAREKGIQNVIIVDDAGLREVQV